MYKYLSQDKPNRTRQPELDLAKFIAIFLMIVCHCGIYFYEEGTIEYRIYDIIGGEFAAPVFMACMGIGVVFSHHNEPKLLINRGFKLVLFGYLLNFIRGTIPSFIAGIIFSNNSVFRLAPSFYMVDILQFAGLAMVLMGLFKKWKIEPFYQMMLGLLMAGLGEILGYKSTGFEWLDAICDLVWGANEWSFFPILNWFIYPAAGVFFGEILMHCNDKTALYKRLLPIGIIGVGLSYYLLFTDDNYYPCNSSYYIMGIKNVVYGLCFPILLFSVCYFVTKVSNLGDNSFVGFSSKNLNTLYCISWVLILWTWGVLLVLFEIEMTPVLFASLTIAIFVISYVLCYVWKKLKRKKN